MTIIVLMTHAHTCLPFLLSCVIMMPLVSCSTVTVTATFRSACPTDSVCLQTAARATHTMRGGPLTSQAGAMHTRWVSELHVPPSSCHSDDQDCSGVNRDHAISDDACPAAFIDCMSPSQLPLSLAPSAAGHNLQSFNTMGVSGEASNNIYPVRTGTKVSQPGPLR